VSKITVYIPSIDDGKGPVVAFVAEVRGRRTEDQRTDVRTIQRTDLILHSLRDISLFKQISRPQLRRQISNAKLEFLCFYMVLNTKAKQ
jgi:predicted SnoaL-like aldol condensation-catalyzing enzyme